MYNFMMFCLYILNQFSVDRNTLCIRLMHIISLNIYNEASNIYTATIFDTSKSENDYNYVFLNYYLS